MNRLIAVSAFSIALAAGLALGQEANWPCFRGPGRYGVSAEKGLPLTWSDTSNIVWKTRLPGPGASSPITWGDRIYLTCYSGYGPGGRYEELKRHLICLAKNGGRILWDVSFTSQVPDSPYGDFINRHGYASSTPTVDDSGIYTYFGTWGARAYDHAGKLKWEHSCGTKYFNFGSAASPVLFGDLVIINASVEDRAIIALHKQTGREAWRVPVGGHSYSTPLVVKSGPADELVYPLGEDYENGKAKPSGLAAVDARSGKSLWQCISINANLYPSPIAHDGIIYGVANRTVAIRAGGRGDVTASHLAWDVNQGSEVSSPVLHDGHLYWADQEGIARCLDAKSGEVVYKQRLDPPSGPIYASGIVADGKLYYVSREKGTYVLAAQPRYELLAHNTLTSDTSVFNGTPAVSRGQLLLRSDRYLYCIGTATR